MKVIPDQVRHDGVRKSKLANNE